MTDQRQQANQPNSMAEHQYRQMEVNQPDDEINLLDIYRFFHENKKIILLVTLLTALLGSAYVLLSSEMYKYSIAIQLGAISRNGNDKALSTAKTIVSEINELTIASVLHEYYDQHPEQAKTLDIHATVPKDSEIIVLSSKASDKNLDIYVPLLTQVSNKLITEQNEKIKEFKNHLASQIENAKKRVEELTHAENETNQRINNFQKLFKSSPLDNSGTTTLVITQLFGQIQSLSREKFSLETQIAAMETDLQFTDYSKALSSVSKSIKPVNIDKKIIVLSSIILGFLLGALVALSLNVMAKIKNQMKSTV